MQKKDVRLGALLLAQGAVTQDGLDEAMRRLPGDHGRRLGETLVSLGHCTNLQVAAALAEQFGLPFQDLRNATLENAIVRLIPAELAFRHQVLPLARREGVLLVAMADPANHYALEDVRLVTGLNARACVADADEVRRLCEQHYLQQEAESQAPVVGDGIETVAVRDDDNLGDIASLAGEALVVRLVNLMLRQAVNEGASDIHVEPFEDEMRIRFRVDGVLRSVPAPSKRMHNVIASRIKIMAELDIAERRKPQDGRIKVRVAGREVDVRVSTLPTLYGESVVMRLLDRDPSTISLAVLGFPPATLERFQRLLKTPYGIILATGPTGSGKTTTLYAALQEVSSPKRKVITIEDPVEYRLPGINQMHVRPKIGLTFAEGLRHILRQDPDIIMVGEIRDSETADIAIHAALTGHLVFSTLHTNDSAGTVARLLDMGIEPYFVAGSLEGVLAQRLVRRLCPDCKQPYEPTEPELAEVGVRRAEAVGRTLYRAAGCGECRGTGYRGRVGLYELLLVDEVIGDLVLRRASSRAIKDAAQERGMVTLREEGWRSVCDGITSIEEIGRVTHEDEVALGVGDDDARAG